MKKILIVVDNLNPNNSSGAKVNLSFIQNLVNDGFIIHVAHYTRIKIDSSGFYEYRIKENRINFLYFFSKVQQRLQQFLGINFNKYIESVLGFSLAHFNDVASMSSFLNRYLPLINPHLVITLSQAASFRPHKAMLNFPQFYDRWIAYFHDPYPFACYPRPYDWVEPGHRQKLRFMQRVFDNAAILSFPSLYLNNWMASYYISDKIKKKQVIIPHQMSGYLDNLIPQCDYPPIFAPFFQDNFILLHAGSLMDARNPIPMKKAFLIFLEQHPEARKDAFLFFVGKKSSYHPDLNRSSQEVPQVKVTEDYLNYNFASFLQKKASVNIILEAKAPFSPFLPGKFPHCVQANKPILYLGPRLSETIRLLGEDYLYQAEIDDVKQIVVAITKLYTTWKANRGDLMLDRPDLERYLSKETLIATINQL